MADMETAALKRRVAELEAVIADYVERYGLTEAARKAMLGWNTGKGMH